METQKKVIEILENEFGWEGLETSKGLLDVMMKDTIKATKKAFNLPVVVVSEERTELPDEDIKGFAKYVLSLANRTVKRKANRMTEDEGDELINDLWLKYKFNTPVPQGN